jgi:hypothetical protein
MKQTHISKKRILVEQLEALRGYAKPAEMLAEELDRMVASVLKAWEMNRERGAETLVLTVSIEELPAEVKE